jgi:hypothetical protein
MSSNPVPATGKNSQLAMAESDPAFGQIVWREFKGDFVARQNANAIPAEPAREVRQYDAFVLELHAEKSAGELFENGSGYFYAVFLTHCTSYALRLTDEKRASAVLTAQPCDQFRLGQAPKKSSAI